MKKQSMTNGQFLRLHKNAIRLVEEDTKYRIRLRTKFNRTVKDLKKFIKGKNTAYAWSGGKDSIALQILCEAAYIPNSMIGVSNLEYPEYMEWVKMHSPKGITTVNTGQDMDWLVSHPHMLFPTEGKYGALWFKIIQHTAQRKFYFENNLDVIVLGRRKEDGNFVGRGENWYTDVKGVTRYSPMADWTHEEVFSLIYYSGKELPPIYNWPRGYVVGTGAWPARQWCKDAQQGWEEVYQIDMGIVVNSAQHIDSAKYFLDNRR